MRLMYKEDLVQPSAQFLVYEAMQQGAPPATVASIKKRAELHDMDELYNFMHKRLTAQGPPKKTVQSQRPR